MAKRYWGSINLDSIKEAIASGIDPFEGKKGKYVPVSVWVEDEPDRFGNSCSVSMYNKESKQSFYLANLKEGENSTGSGSSQPVKKEPDLPF